LGIACDDPTGGAPPVLNGSYLRVLDIHYGNSSVVAFHASLADDPTGGCRGHQVQHVRRPRAVAVSRANWELFLCSNCSRTPPAGSVPMNCTATGRAPAPWLVYLSRRSYEAGGGPVQDATSTG
jgi:hypothetical protein